jgi:hypothetical protein
LSSSFGADSKEEDINNELVIVIFFWNTIRIRNIIKKNDDGYLLSSFSKTNPIRKGTKQDDKTCHHLLLQTCKKKIACAIA